MYGFFNKVEVLILLWCVLVAVFVVIYVCFLRGNLIDMMHEDYICTVWVKGLLEWRVVICYGVRVVIMLIVTLLGFDIGILFGGAILIEMVFNI